MPSRRSRPRHYHTCSDVPWLPVAVQGFPVAVQDGKENLEESLATRFIAWAHCSRDVASWRAARASFHQVTGRKRVWCRGSRPRSARRCRIVTRVVFWCPRDWRCGRTVKVVLAAWRPRGGSRTIARQVADFVVLTLLASWFPGSDTPWCRGSLLVLPRTSVCPPTRLAGVRKSR